MMRRLSFIITRGALALFFYLQICAQAAAAVKQPDVAGQFYPGNKKILGDQIDSFLKNVSPDAALMDKEIYAIIVPHAGYRYSGQIAAYAYALLEARDFQSVIIISASHFHNFNGIAVYAHGAFRTPFGDCPIDEQLARELISFDKAIVENTDVFTKEHPIEVEIPFVQKTAGDCGIVPVIMGQVSYDEALMFSRALKQAIGDKKVLVLVSSDLSHYHSYEQANTLDATTCSFIESLDPRGLMSAYARKDAELCGLFPAVSLLHYAKDSGLEVKLLNYANSGDATGEKNQVVGYASFVFYAEKESAHKSKDNRGDSEMFNDTQKKRLLAIARETITQYAGEKTRPRYQEDDPGLQIKRGLFVTLHKHGQLRGCIGAFSSTKPIYEEVSRLAIQSANEDPRFPAVRADEVDNLDIEISVLTEPEPIDDWKKIRLGIDGVIVRRGFNSGVFLPQVATETGWDLEEFLGQLCAGKAGLPSDAYKKSGTNLFTFQAVIFSEKEIK